MPRKKLSQMSDEEREAHYIEIIQNFTIFDDFFMCVVLENKECTEHILQIIMDRKDLKVVRQTVQYSHKNMHGRSGILDCVATDETGKKYDIEIQQISKKAYPRRARYYSSLLDTHSLESGEDYDKLPECYVIFITADDMFGEGKPIYYVDRYIRDSYKPFDDGSHIIYVDSSKQDDTRLGRLMHDLHCKEADNFYSEILRQRVRELKETRKGEKDMCQSLQELIDYNASDWLEEGKRKGGAAGRAEALRFVAINLYQNGNDLGFISSMTNVPISTVQEWVGAPTA